EVPRRTWARSALPSSRGRLCWATKTLRNRVSVVSRSQALVTSMRREVLPPRAVHAGRILAMDLTVGLVEASRLAQGLQQLVHAALAPCLHQILDERERGGIELPDC